MKAKNLASCEGRIKSECRNRCINIKNFKRIIFFIFVLLICVRVNSSTCSNSTSAANIISSETCTQSTLTTPAIHDVKYDSSAGYFYIGYGQTGGSTDNVIFGNLNTDFSSNWQKAYPGNRVYSFEIDSNKSFLYISLVNSGVLYMLRVNSGNGNIQQKFTYSTNICTSYGCRIAYDDNNSLYISGNQALFKCNNALQNCDKYTISNIDNVDQLLRVKDNKFYISSYVSGSSYYSSLFIDLSNQSFKWGKTIACTSCSNKLQPADSRNEQIYLLLYLNPNAFFTIINSSDGSLTSTLYLFTEACTWVSFIYAQSSKTIIGFQSSSTQSVLKVYDNSSSFTTYMINTSIMLYGYYPIYSSSSSSSSSQIVMAGSSSTSLYMMKSFILGLASHSDIQSNTTASMSLASSPTIGSLSSTMSSSSSISDTNVALPSVVSSTITCTIQFKSDTSFWLDDITQTSVAANSNITISNTFTCSVSGSSTITAAFSTDKSNAIPSWGTIDLANNKLNFNVPYVSSDTTYTFTIKIQSSEGAGYAYYITVTLYVKACKASNCSTCNSSDASKCVTCASGYTLSNSSCISSSLSSSASAASTVTSIGAVVGIVAAASSSMLTLSSPQSMWGVVNQFQTLTFLLLTKAYFPEETTSSFTGLSDYTSFSFSFIPFSSLNVFSWFSSPIDGSTMEKVGLKSGSTFLNNISLIFSILLIIFLHMIFLLIRRLLEKKLTTKPRLKKIIEAIYKLFTLCLYLRILMEAYQFLLICSTDEIYKFSNNSDGKLTSLILAFIVFILCIAFALLVLIITIKEVKGVSERTHSLFKEFFNGTKDTKLSKWFSFMFIIRKALIIIFMGFLTDIDIIAKVAIFVFVQALYLCYVVIIRPLEKRKDNIILILNETLMLLLANMLFKYNTESDWTSSSKSVFYMSISCVSMIVAVICIVDLIIVLIKGCIMLKNKVKAKRSEDYVEKINPNEPDILNNPSMISNNQMNTIKVANLDRGNSFDEISNNRNPFNVNVSHSRSDLKHAKDENSENFEIPARNSNIGRNFYNSKNFEFHKND